MKSWMLVSLVALNMIGCSSTNTPTPQKLSRNVQSIPSATIISALNEHDLAVPKNAEAILKLATFKASDNLYDEMGNSLLIPRGAVITGLYTNDGVTCDIEWRGVYANYNEFKEQRGTLSLANVTNHSICDPQRGIRQGERVTIGFKGNLVEE